MADNLDDEWWTDNATIGKTSEAIDDEEDAEKSESESEKELTPAAKKKKKSSDEQSTTKKKKKSKSKISEVLAKEHERPLQPSDLITALTTHYHSKLSAIEADEIALEDQHFAVCNDLTHTPTSYLKFLIPHWKRITKQLSGQPGSPMVLIICSAGLRAVQFIREISDFKAGGCKIAKLFAKHLKLKDQSKFLKKTVIHIGVGTPNRITQLLQSGCLRLDCVKYVVVDWSHRDLKQRRLVHIRETRTDLVELLRHHVIPRVKDSENSAKIALL